MVLHVHAIVLIVDVLSHISLNGVACVKHLVAIRQLQFLFSLSCYIVASAVNNLYMHKLCRSIGVQNFFCGSF